MGFANQKRGLRLADPGFEYLSEGVYGVIFVNRTCGRIRKIYRFKKDKAHVCKVFRAETDAYCLAMANESIVSLIPRFFRICSEQVVYDKCERNISEEYFPDLAFEAEYIACRFQKIGEIDQTEAWRIRNLFHAASIRHTADMSVCLDGCGQVARCIDFAVEEHELSHND